MQWEAKQERSRGESTQGGESKQWGSEQGGESKQAGDREKITNVWKESNRRGKQGE
jgi:hypothetical protein